MGFKGLIGLVVCLELLACLDGEEDYAVGAFDAWDFDAEGEVGGAVGEFAVVVAEGVAEAVDVEFAAADSKGREGEVEAEGIVDARGLHEGGP